jgi:hypothetical protein
MSRNAITGSDLAPKQQVEVGNRTFRRLHMLWLIVTREG